MLRFVGMLLLIEPPVLLKKDHQDSKNSKELCYDKFNTFCAKGLSRPTFCPLTDSSDSVPEICQSVEIKKTNAVTDQVYSDSPARR